MSTATVSRDPFARETLSFPDEVDRQILAEQQESFFTQVGAFVAPADCGPEPQQEDVPDWDALLFHYTEQDW